MSGASGTYTVTVTHKGSLSGGSQNYSLIITGKSGAPAAPVANFSADDITPVIGQVVNFSDLSLNIPTSWNWSFSGPGNATYVGGTNANSQNPQVQFDAVGNYTVTLIATNAYGNDTEIKTNYISVTSCSYCTSDGNMTYQTSTTLVDFNTIHNVTAKPSGYNDYTSQSTDVMPGNSYNLSVNVNTDGNYTTQTYVWIDWNQNCDFTDAGEVYNLGSASNVANGATSASPYNITVPAGAVPGSTRMRVSTRYSSVPTSCITGMDGEVEDYTVNVIGGGSPPVADFEADNVAPGIGETVNFTDLSTNSPDTWLWSFTPSTITYIGGTTATDQNPQVEFDAAGNYTVELTVTNVSGSDTETKTDYIDVSIPVYDLEIKAFLEGPFNGSLMNSDISSVLPLNQPYNVAPWNYNGSETVVSIPGSNIVDWIVVELRDALSAPQASSATILNQQAAFLRNDGQVVDLNGNPVLNFEEIITNNLYVVIHHRNHLSIMSSTSLTETTGTFSYDFSTSVNKAYLNGQNLLGGGYSGMMGGNGVPQDNTVNSSDKSFWETDAGTTGYLFSDYNLDGETNNPDKNDIWIPNEGESSQIPN